MPRSKGAQQARAQKKKPETKGLKEQVIEYRGTLGTLITDSLSTEKAIDKQELEELFEKIDAGYKSYCKELKQLAAKNQIEISFEPIKAIKHLWFRVRAFLFLSSIREEKEDTKFPDLFNKIFLEDFEKSKSTFEFPLAGISRSVSHNIAAQRCFKEEWNLQLETKTEQHWKRLYCDQLMPFLLNAQKPIPVLFLFQEGSDEFKKKYLTTGTAGVNTIKWTYFFLCPPEGYLVNEVDCKIVYPSLFENNGFREYGQEEKQSIRAILGGSDEGIKKTFAEYANTILEILLRQQQDHLARFHKAEMFFPLTLELPKDRGGLALSFVEGRFFTSAEQELHILEKEGSKHISETMLIKAELHYYLFNMLYFYSLRKDLDPEEKGVIEEKKNFHLRQSAKLGYKPAQEDCAVILGDRKIQKKIATRGGNPAIICNEAVDLLLDDLEEGETQEVRDAKIEALASRALEKGYKAASIPLGDLFVRKADRIRAIDSSNPDKKTYNDTAAGYYEQVADCDIADIWVKLAQALYFGTDREGNCRRVIELLDMAKQSDSKASCSMAILLLSQYIPHYAVLKLESFSGKIRLQKEKDIDSLGTEFFELLVFVKAGVSAYMEMRRLSEESLQNISYSMPLSAIQLNFLIKRTFNLFSLLFFLQQKNIIFCTWFNEEKVKQYIAEIFGELVFPQEDLENDSLQPDREVFEEQYSKFLYDLSLPYAQPRPSSMSIESEGIDRQESAVQSEEKHEIERESSEIEELREEEFIETKPIEGLKKLAFSNNLYLASDELFRFCREVKKDLSVIDKEGPLAQLERFLQALSATTGDIGGIGKALLGLGWLQIHPNTPQLKEMQEIIFSKLLACFNSLSSEDISFSLRGLSYLDLTEQGEFLCAFLQKISEEEQARGYLRGLSFSGVAAVLHALAILHANFRANRTQPELFERLTFLIQNILEVLLSDALYALLNKMQPYPLLHEFVLAAHYFYCVGEGSIEKLWVDPSFVDKWRYVGRTEGVKAKTQNGSGLQDRLTAMLQTAYPDLQTERLLGILPGDCFCKGILFEINGPCHFFKQYRFLFPTETKYPLQETVNSLFRCYYKKMAYQKETGEPLSVINVPYTETFDSEDVFLAFVADEIAKARQSIVIPRSVEDDRLKKREEKQRIESSDFPSGSRYIFLAGPLSKREEKQGTLSARTGSSLYERSGSGPT